MRIPYRTRRAIGRWAIVLLVVAVFVMVALLCWWLWLGRFVVYTDNGIYFDPDRSSLEIAGEPALPPENQETVSIYYNEGENAINVSTELTQLNGYYITTADLKGDIPALREQLRQLPKETPVMVEVKNSFGEMNYTSTVSSYHNSSVDQKAVDGLIEQLSKSGVYAIAKVTAFQDYHYGLNNVDEGLFSTGGAYLWRDDLGCYWLSPSSDKVLSYMVQIATELRALGFDEVVFDQFRFPQSDGYRFGSSKQEALDKAAETLATSCVTNSFAVSFVSDQYLTVPQGRSRLYLSDVDAGDAANMASQIAVPDQAIYLVFLTELHDTRFDVYGVMRPITSVK